MFAKLKKKIQEEGGASGGEGSPGPAHGGPGLASPIRRDSSSKLIVLGPLIECSINQSINARFKLWKIDYFLLSLTL